MISPVNTNTFSAPITSLSVGNSDTSKFVGYLLFVRHVQSQANKQNGFAGSGMDSPPSKMGIKQAQYLQSNIQALLNSVGGYISKVYTSMLQRAQFTAQRIAEVSGQPPLIASADINEIHWGDGTGLTRQQINEYYGKEYSDRVITKINPNVRPFKGGETLYDVYRRAYPFLHSNVLNLNNFVAGPNGEAPVVVLAGHSNLFKSLIYGLMKNSLLVNFPFELSESGRMHISNGDMLLFRVYYNSHKGLTLLPTDQTNTILRKSVDEN